jgi:hypothetical protein
VHTITLCVTGVFATTRSWYLSSANPSSAAAAFP